MSPPYYPAKRGARLTIAEVTEGRKKEEERKREVVVVERREEAAKRQLIIPKPQKQSAHMRSPHRTQSLYTTSVCVLRLCHLVLLIYETLQVPWRRCRALQFMSNLVNILSPVRPVSHCFPRCSVPPRLPSLVSGRRLSERNQVLNNIFRLIRAPLFSSVGGGAWKV